MQSEWGRMMIRDAYSNEVKPDKKVKLAGFVHEKRDLGKLIFLILRDREGFIQVTAKKDRTKPAVYNTIKKLGKEWLVSVNGAVVENKSAPSGLEVLPSDIEVISEAETPLPLEIAGKAESNFDTRLDYRFLDMRRPANLAIFKFQNKIVKYLNDFMQENRFVRIFTSRLTSSATEGGTDYFPVLYFNKEAFLAQSPQLYKEAVLASGIDLVYDIGFVYRAEPHHTTRHLCEFTSFDFEMISESVDDVLDMQEKMIIYLFKNLNADKECKDILKMHNAELKVPKKIPRYTFNEANEILKKLNVKVDKDDLTPDGEKALSEYCLGKYGTTFVVVKEFPFRKKPFYLMRKGKDSSHSFDLLYNGLELTSGGQREHRYKERVKNIKLKDLDPKLFYDLVFYKYGMPPHGGLGMGIERLTMKILGLKNVKEAVLLPRDPDRLKP